MEQKQLDEVEDSFFGEEFIDDEDLLEAPVKAAPAKKSTSKKSKTTKAKAAKEEPEEIIIKPAKETPKPVAKPAAKEEPKAPEVKITPAVNTDPWDEPEDSGMFKEVSTWKAITGIVVILLIFSVFTQGFQFSESPTGATTGELTLAQAERKALDYVNANLLQPPFLAEVESSSEEQGLYKVTLSVAGRSVDSYLTKDGSLFFPQGFDTARSLDSLIEEESLDQGFEEEPGVEEDLPDISNEEPTEEAMNEPMEEPMEEESMEEPSEETGEPLGLPVEEEFEPEGFVPGIDLTLDARKWLFEPATLTATQGDEVRLTINPTGLDFTFALPEFGVEQEVSGPTVVEFVADQSGSFDFTCSSCEDWRGMKGTLVVE